LFDFDGVLADTEPIHYQSWRSVLEPLGISVSWETYRSNFVGVADDDVVPRVLKISDRAAAQAMVERKRAVFRAALEVSPPFLKETLSLLRDLSSRYAMAVVSSSARTEVEPPLVRAGVRDCFRLVITFEDVTHVKPAAEPYLKAARLLGAQRPLVIEDSPSGIAAGEAAGFDVLRIESPDRLAESVQGSLGTLPITDIMLN
jgi:beta-phosphoglucomutase